MLKLSHVGRAVCVLAACTGLSTHPSPAQAESLTIGAAYSLRAAFEEILPIFELEQDVTMQVQYGPSQTLRRRIEQGAAIDVFLPAAVSELEALTRQGLTSGPAPRLYAQSSLVLVMSATSKATPVSFRAMPSDQAVRIALGHPKTFALGAVTAGALAALGPAYQSRFVPLYAQHSEEILERIRRGDADVGLLYRVDAINNGQVRIIDEKPSGRVLSMPFGAARVSTCRSAAVDTAEKFLDFMTTPRIQKLLLKYGFESAPSAEPGAGELLGVTTALRP